MRHVRQADWPDGSGYHLDVTVPCRQDLDQLTPLQVLDAFNDHLHKRCRCGKALGVEVA